MRPAVPVRLTVVGALQKLEHPAGGGVGVPGRWFPVRFAFDDVDGLVDGDGWVILEHPLHVGADVLFALFGGVAGLAGGHGEHPHGHKFSEHRTAPRFFALATVGRRCRPA